MLRNLSHFFLYNNVVPLAIGILFLGGGAALAASPEVRDAVFSSDTSILSIDNSYIVHANLEAHPFELVITSVTEDDANYYVGYSLHTIDIADGVWRDLTKERTLSVEKAFLQERDLGVYVTEELAEVRSAERSRLIETQAIERSIGEQVKVVATVYSGLVGKILSPSEEVFEGYMPVIAPVVETATPEPQIAGASTAAEPPPPPQETPQSGDTVAPVITLFGNNPAQLKIGDVYGDLGAAVVDNHDINIGIHVFQGGREVVTPFIDTRVSGTHTILYRATDHSGNVGEATRTVMVGTLGD